MVALVGAVGLWSTSDGPAPEFTASWSEISVASSSQAAALPNPSGYLGITLKNTMETSGFTSNSFEVENMPEGGPSLVSMSIDTSTAILPQIVFDPDGTAGDDGSPKPFTVDSKYGKFDATATYDKPLDGGFQKLDVQFNDFGPGERLTFSIDADPSNILGAAAPGPAETGSISGLEMIGSTITMSFSDGSVRTTRIFQDPEKTAGASALLQDQQPTAPMLTIDGFSSGDETLATSHTVTVTGTPGETVRLIVAEGGLYTDGVSPDALEPQGANKLLSVQRHEALIEADGDVDIAIMLTDTDGADGSNTGWNYIAAALVDSDATYGDNVLSGPMSDPFLLQYNSGDPFTL